MTEAKKPAARKPGRPRKFGQGRINATVRFSPQRYEMLRLEADQNGRSISEQVEHMVEQTLLLQRLAKSLRTSYLRECNDNKVLRLALDELKTASRDELLSYLKLGGSELAEIIEAAVTRALARARLTINGDDK